MIIIDSKVTKNTLKSDKKEKHTYFVECVFGTEKIEDIIKRIILSHQIPTYFTNEH